MKKSSIVLVSAMGVVAVLIAAFLIFIKTVL
jgi:hypothetical protein